MRAAFRLSRRAPFLFLLLALGVLGARDARAATGGPDAFGYRWFDSDSGLTDSVVPPYAPTTDLRAAGLNGDENVLSVLLPTAVFPTGFPFYGTNYPRVWISSNGWLSFVNPMGQTVPFVVGVPTAGRPDATIAYFWANLDVNTAAPPAVANAGPNVAGDGYTIYVRAAPVGQPLNVADFYVTLYRNGEIKMVYQGDIDGARSFQSVTIGIENAAGTIGLPFKQVGAVQNGAAFRTDFGVLFTPFRRLSCAVAGAIDVPSGLPVGGDTSFSTDTVETYGCAGSAYSLAGHQTGYTGPEQVWQFTITTPSTVSFSLDTAVPGLRAFLLSGCDEGTCTYLGACSETLPPGTYHVVVDGLAGAAGPYVLSPFVTQQSPYSSYWDCPVETPRGNPVPTRYDATPGRNNWDFDSGSYCGTGCDFSLFAVVECGTEFHIPFWDVESGHMQIYDVLNQRQMFLTAVNDETGACAFSTSGTQVDWVSNGCPGGGNNDCRFNNAVMDVSFTDPNLCGVYRLDFIDWGGYIWEVFANCTGQRSPQFLLYRDACSALANYHPRPEIGIESVTVDPAGCPSRLVQGTFVAQNIGCAPAFGVRFSVEQAPPLPPNPILLPPVDIVRGGQVVVPFAYAVSSVPAELVIRVDPFDLLGECSEALGGAVSCGNSGALTRAYTEPACSAFCSTTADAGTGAQLCQGEPLVLDGSASVLVCVNGTPEYRWEDASGTALPGCDWSASSVTCPVDTALLPPGSQTLTLLTRCNGDNPACDGSSTVTFDVVENVAPPALGNVLLQAKQAVVDVQIQWTPFPPSPLVSAYGIYVNPAKSLPAASRTLLAWIDPAISLVVDSDGVNRSPVPGATFYQVVGLSCFRDREGPY